MERQLMKKMAKLKLQYFGHTTRGSAGKVLWYVLWAVAGTKYQGAARMSWIKSVLKWSGKTSKSWHNIRIHSRGYPGINSPHQLPNLDSEDSTLRRRRLDIQSRNTMLQQSQRFPWRHSWGHFLTKINRKKMAIKQLSACTCSIQLVHVDVQRHMLHHPQITP